MSIIVDLFLTQYEEKYNIAFLGTHLGMNQRGRITCRNESQLVRKHKVNKNVDHFLLTRNTKLQNNPALLVTDLGTNLGDRNLMQE